MNILSLSSHIRECKCVHFLEILDVSKTKFHVQLVRLVILQAAALVEPQPSPDCSIAHLDQCRHVLSSSSSFFRIATLAWAFEAIQEWVDRVNIKDKCDKLEHVLSKVIYGPGFQAIA